MLRCPPHHWLWWLLLLASTGWLPATTIIAPDFNRLVNSADYIVRARVKAVTSEWRENPAQPGQRYIGSSVELEVLETIKGAPPSPLVLDLVGGRIGDKELQVDGAPSFQVGQEDILFIRGNGRLVVPIVGMRHGQYPVRRDPLTGEDQVMRAGGRLLYSVDEVNLPPGVGSRTLTRDPRAKPLTAAQFANHIRLAVRETPENENLR